MLRLATVALLAALALTAVASPSQAARGPVRVATETETHELAIAIKQPRWSCFSGRIAHDGRWASLRRLPHAGCPDLPYAIVVRADAQLGWKEQRRFGTRRRACAARRPRLSAALKHGLYGCPAPRRER